MTNPAPVAPELPPLPTPAVPNTRLGFDQAYVRGSYTADQMHAYGRACLAAQVAPATATEPAEQGKRHHELKTDPLVFDAVASGAKTHEIRFNDRGFQVGDVLRLRRTAFSGAQMKTGSCPLVYTGEELTRTVSHVLTGYGLIDGWCILSLAAPVHQVGAAGESVRIPTSEYEASLMALTGMEWLKHNAPHWLKKVVAAPLPEPSPAASGSKPK